MQTYGYEEGGDLIIKKTVQKKLKINGQTLIALGVGILISAILMSMSYKSKLKFDIETKAREMGMVYPEELKIGDLEKKE